MLADILQGSHHDCQWFCRTSLSGPQGPYRISGGRIAGEVKAAQSLDGQYLACQQHLAGQAHGGIAGSSCIVPCVAGCPFEPDVRAADRAGVGLGMEPAVERVIVLALAIGAHGKGLHCRQRAVVRNVPDDGKARATIGAIGEGIAIAPVIWIQ